MIMNIIINFVCNYEFLFNKYLHIWEFSHGF